ncbi:MAG TPA: M56 family metallopeptidase [Gemmatimonadaceae bacterium]|nr:M56 family metallopeptidase [Gemmatimonadaceae bacterium]
MSVLQHLVSPAEAVSIVTLLMMKTSVVLACGFAADRSVPRGAAARAAIWSVVFGLIGFLPIASILAPTLEMPIAEFPHAVMEQSVTGTALPFTIAFLIALTWGLGSILRLARFGIDVAGARRLVRHASPAPPCLSNILTAVMSGAGITRVVKLVVSPETRTPATIGFFRPVVILPPESVAWPVTQLRAVLIHELAHIARNDWLLYTVERIVCSVFWPNPLVHLASRQAAIARELAADDAVLRAGVDREAYAERVISVARLSRYVSVLEAGAVAFAKRSSLEVRVRALFDLDRDRTAGWRPFALRFSAAMLAIVILTAAAQPWTCLPTVASGSTTVADE